MVEISMGAYDALAEVLDTSPDHRVLRRFYPQMEYEKLNTRDVKLGAYVDVETTSLDDDAKIIELAIVTFTFASDGRVGSIVDAVGWFNDPGIPIPPLITEITGLTDNDVRGASIDIEMATALIHRADLVIAHNAAFDRVVLERELPTIPWAVKPWGCSYRDVPWREAGVDGGKLVHVLMQGCGLFYDAHRALDDCYAGVHALAQTFAMPALWFLLGAVERPTIRLWATGAPFSVKDKLKARGYHWNAEPRPGRPKAWYRDLDGGDEAGLTEEREWLRTAAWVTDPATSRITAVDRYSTRE